MVKAQRLARLSELLKLDLTCEICGKRFKDLRDVRVDHDHVTEKARGLLCNSCNVGLGFFKDNPQFLLRAIKYLNLDPEVVAVAREAFRRPPLDPSTLLSDKQVAELTGLQPNDVWRASRKEDDFPKCSRYWSEREVRAWIASDIQRLDKLRQRYDEERRATAAEATFRHAHDPKYRRAGWRKWETTEHP